MPWFYWMRKNAIIKMINNFYHDLSEKNEAARAISFLKKPWRNRLITRIMKKQWDRIEDDPET